MAVSQLQKAIEELTTRARTLGLTDTAWAAKAGIPKETLSRLRRRSSCDFESLEALASAVAMRICTMDSAQATGALFPLKLDRHYEERLAELCASGDMDLARWRSFGPAFFMAGLAVMLASSNGVDRPALLKLAEELHAGMTEPAVFRRWLKSSPIRADRFLPMVDAQLLHAA